MKVKNIVVGLAGLFILILQGCGSSTGSGSSAATTNSITMQGSLSLTGATTSGIVGSGVLALGASVSTREGDAFYCITFEDDPQAFKADIEDGEFAGDYEGGAAKAFGCFLVTPESTLPVVVDLSEIGEEALAVAGGSALSWTTVYNEKTSIVTATVKITKGNILGKDEWVGSGEDIDLTGLTHQIYKADETASDFYGLNKQTSTKKAQQGPGPEDTGVPPWITLHYSDSYVDTDGITKKPLDAKLKLLLLSERPTRAIRDKDGNWIFRICKEVAGQHICEVLDVGKETDTKKERFEKYLASWQRVIANIIPASVVEKWKEQAAITVKPRFAHCNYLSSREYKIGYRKWESNRDFINPVGVVAHAGSGHNTSTPSTPAYDADTVFNAFQATTLADIVEVPEVTLAQRWDGGFLGDKQGEAVVAVADAWGTHNEPVQAWTTGPAGDVVGNRIVVDLTGAELIASAVLGLGQEGPVAPMPPAPGVWMPKTYRLAKAIPASDLKEKAKTGEISGDQTQNECAPAYQAREEFLEVMRNAGQSMRSAVAIVEAKNAAVHGVSGSADHSVSPGMPSCEVRVHTAAEIKDIGDRFNQGQDYMKDNVFGGGPVAYNTPAFSPAPGGSPIDYNYYQAPSPMPNYSPYTPPAGGGDNFYTQPAPGYSPAPVNPDPSPYYSPPLTGVIALGQFGPVPGESPYIPAPIPGDSPNYNQPAPAPSVPGMPGPEPVASAPPAPRVDDMLNQMACKDGDCTTITESEIKDYFNFRDGNVRPECAFANNAIPEADLLAMVDIVKDPFTVLPNDNLRPDITCAPVAQTTEDSETAGAATELGQSGPGGQFVPPPQIVCEHELLGDAWPSDVFAAVKVTSIGNLVKGTSLTERDHRFKVGEEYQGCYESEGIDINLKQIGEEGIGVVVDEDGVKHHRLTSTHKWLAAFTINSKNTCKFVSYKGTGSSSGGEMSQYDEEDNREATEAFQADLTPVSKGDADYPPQDWFDQMNSGR